MLQWLSRYRDVVTVLVCLLVPGVILYAQRRSDAEAGPAVRAITRMTAPLQDAAATAIAGVADWWDEHRQTQATIEEARKLRMELARVRVQASRAEELERENQRLRDLLGAHPTAGTARIVGARVVAVGASPAYRTVRIDVGRDDGVQRGMAVLSPEGALGSILRTTATYSDVLLISDRQSAVDVVLPRGNARGILKGPGAEEETLLRVDGLDRTDDVKPGDEVVASGLGARFPRGTRVGTVVSVEQPEGGSMKVAMVQAAVRYHQVRNVLVVLTPEDRAFTQHGPIAEPTAPMQGPQPINPVPPSTSDSKPAVLDGGPLVEPLPEFVKAAPPDGGAR